jgi:hypothetical protein
VEFGKLEEGKLYAKVGRTTGLTVGTYRGVMACSWKREKDRIRMTTVETRSKLRASLRI